MSKGNKNRGKANGDPTNGIVTAPSRTGVTGAPLRPRAAARDPWLAWRWLIFVLAGLTLVAVWGGFAAHRYGVWPFGEREEVVKGKLLDEGPKQPGPFDELARQMQQLPPQPKWQIEAWKPVTQDDQLIDRFEHLHRSKNSEAYALLAALPADDRPVTEEEAGRRDANAFLRDKDVRIVEIWRGEPGSDGKPRPAARRYTLVTKGSVRPPEQRVRQKDGKVTVESGRLIDPVIVVEVQQDKDGPRIQPLRAEINKAP